MADKIIKNASKAYGYNYASLSDIIAQGQELPKMRLSVKDGNDYVEYFDGSEWQTGARIVVPSMKGSNEAQAYGAALTYARRYTALMALSLACDDDKTVETSEKAEAPAQKKFDLKEADKAIAAAKTADEVRGIYAKGPKGLQQYVEKSCKAKIRELES